MLNILYLTSSNLNSCEFSYYVPPPQTQKITKSSRIHIGTENLIVSTTQYKCKSHSIPMIQLTLDMKVTLIAAFADYKLI
jgi:hypothetical protein